MFVIVQYRDWSCEFYKMACDLEASLEAELSLLDDEYYGERIEDNEFNTEATIQWEWLQQKWVRFRAGYVIWT